MARYHVLNREIPSGQTARFDYKPSPPLAVREDGSSILPSRLWGLHRYFRKVLKDSASAPLSIQTTVVLFRTHALAALSDFMHWEFSSKVMCSSLNVVAKTKTKLLHGLPERPWGTLT